jgi:hypothetical protein
MDVVTGIVIELKNCVSDKYNFSFADKELSRDYYKTTFRRLSCDTIDAYYAKFDWARQF